MTVYVGNLSYSVTEEDLTSVFAEYGPVKRIKMPVDRETGRMRGFAFVDMESEEQETTAIEDLDGAEWMERVLKVNKARPRENSPSRSSYSSGGGKRWE